MYHGDVIPMTPLEDAKPPPLCAGLGEGEVPSWDCVGCSTGLRPIVSPWKSAFMSKEPSLSMDISAPGDIATEFPCKSVVMSSPTSPSPIEVGEVSSGKGGWRRESGLVGEIEFMVGLSCEAKRKAEVDQFSAREHNLNNELTHPRGYRGRSTRLSVFLWHVSASSYERDESTGAEIDLTPPAFAQAVRAGYTSLERRDQCVVRKA